MINKISEFLQGKKTYIVAVLTALYTVLQAFNVINTTPEQDLAIYALLAAVFGATIKSAIKKCEYYEE